MSTLTNTEKLKLERLFEGDAGRGYILDYTNSSFSDFILTSTQKSIYTTKYEVYGNSKAKRLRAFWSLEPDNIVGKLTEDMLDYWRAKKLTKDQEIKPIEKALYEDCQNIAKRLLGTSQSKTITEEEFIHQDFGDISLEKLNINSSITPILEQRIDEIKKCLASKAALAAIFLCGSTLEGILLSVAIERAGEFTRANSSPKDKDTGKTKQIQEWSLASLINVSRELNIVGEDVKKFSHVLRDFRNYIHPNQQLIVGFDPNYRTANICWSVLQAAISQISERK